MPTEEDAEITSETTDVTQVTVEDKSQVEDYLRNRGLYVEESKEFDESDEVFDGLAKYMGDKYIYIANAYNMLKQSLTNGREIRHNMQGETQDVVTYTCQFFNTLNKWAMLQYYKYYKSPYFNLVARVSRNPMTINFLTGHWLEKYVGIVVKETLAKYAEQGVNVRYSELVNPKILYSNGDRGELDNLYMINGVMLWIEAKSGEYQEHIGKYSNIKELLGTDKTRSILLLTNTNDTLLANLSKMYGMTVVSITRIREYVENVVGSILGIETDSQSDDNK